MITVLSTLNTIASKCSLSSATIIQSCALVAKTDIVLVSCLLVCSENFLSGCRGRALPSTFTLTGTNTVRNVSSTSQAKVCLEINRLLALI